MGSRVNNYSPSTADLTSLMGTVDATRTGYIALSLTEYDSTARPAIAGGSLVEMAGALFRFSTEEAISTAGILSTVAQYYYVKFSPSSSQCTANFSTTAPVWRSDLQGLYHSTISNNRCLPVKVYFDGLDYPLKASFESLTPNVGRRSTDAALLHDDAPVYGYMSDGTPLYSKTITGTIAGGACTVAHGITSAVSSKKILSLVYNAYSTAYPGNAYVGADSDVVYYTDTNIVFAGPAVTNGPVTFFIVYSA